MLDDGSPPLVAALHRLARVQQRALWLRGLLALNASLGALLLARNLLVSASQGAHPLDTLATIALLALDLAWILWLRESSALLGELGLRSPLGHVGRGWYALIFLPCLFVPALLWGVYQLAQASRPELLPPVTEEREQPAGFRDSALVRVTLGSVATPVVALWLGARILGLAVFPMAACDLPYSLLVATQSVASLASALTAWQIVGAVTHNLAELQRRERARAG